MREILYAEPMGFEGMALGLETLTGYSVFRLQNAIPPPPPEIRQSAQVCSLRRGAYPVLVENATLISGSNGNRPAQLSRAVAELLRA